jgi:hypothetical protein
MVVVGAVPVPFKVIMCGLPVALVERVMPPEIAPVTVGVNVKDMEHDMPDATPVQVLAVIVKGPVTAGPATVRANPPVLVMVNVCAVLVVVTNWAGKLKVVALGLKTGGPAMMPVPVSITVCGLPGALDVMVMVPDAAPTAPGAKIRLSTQMPIAGMRTGMPVCACPMALEPNPQ